MKKLILGVVVALSFGAQSMILPASAAPPLRVLEVEATLESVAEPTGCLVWQMHLRGTIGIFEHGLISVQLVDRCRGGSRGPVILGETFGFLDQGFMLTIDPELDKATWSGSATLLGEPEEPEEGEEGIASLAPLFVSLDLTFCGCGGTERTGGGRHEVRVTSRRAVVTGPVTIGESTFDAFGSGTISSFPLRGSGGF